MGRKLGIFGGTTEGRLLAEVCTESGIFAAVSVATEHGRGLLGESPFLTVHTGRMDAGEMGRWMEDNGLTDVIDATHPFAREASANIKKACRMAGASYHRLVRDGFDMAGGHYEIGESGLETGQSGCGTGQSRCETGQSGCGTGQNGRETGLAGQELGPDRPGAGSGRWEAREGGGRLCLVDSVESAACVLAEEMSAHPDRKALITTGSKELFHFARIFGAKERLYARVLPSEEGLAACKKIGLKGSHIMAMQGPFSYEMNLAMLQTAGASYLVTKESGRAGGFQEKLDAALKLGCQVIVVRRSKEGEEQGKSLEELAAWIRDVYGSRGCEKGPAGAPFDGHRERAESERTGGLEEYEDMGPGKPDLGWGREIVLLGIGTGGLEQMTIEGIRALLDCDAILGASRMVESCRAMLEELRQRGWGGARQRTERLGTGRPGAERLGAEGSGLGGSGAAHEEKLAFCITYRPEEMLAWLEAHPKVRRPVAVYSGDVGFYSGAKKLEELAARQEALILCRRIPGISSMTYLAARLGRCWDEAGVLSLHGRKAPKDWELSDKKEWFLLLDGPSSLYRVCQKLLEEGWPHATIWVGQRLSYKDEVLSFGTPGELMDAKIDGLSAAWVILEEA